MLFNRLPTNFACSFQLNRSFLLFCVAFLLVSKSYGYDTLYVKTNGVAFTNAGNHNSWGTATSDLQAAIDSLSLAGGGEIWVAAGTYIPIKAYNSKDTSFYLKLDVNLFGGFEGIESTKESRLMADIDVNDSIEPWEFVNTTILNGKDTNNRQISHRVLNGEETDSTALVDGFTITNGYQYTNYLDDQIEEGGGAYFCRLNKCILKNNISNCGGGSSRCYISNSLLVNNSANRNSDQGPGGGGAYRCRIVKCTIRNNTSILGAGGVSESRVFESKITKNYAIANVSGALDSELTNCEIYRNLPWEEGYSESKNCKFTNCNLSNSSGSTGFSNCTFNNCIISNNSYSNLIVGGELVNCKVFNNNTYYQTLDFVTVTNTKIFNNLNREDETVGYSIITNSEIYNNESKMGAAVGNSTIINSSILNNNSNKGAVNSHIFNSIITGNYTEQVNDDSLQLEDCEIVYSAIEGGYEGVGNIALGKNAYNSAMFVNPSLVTGRVHSPEELEMLKNADWSLLAGSPCIDTGSLDFYPFIPETDMDGNPRLQGIKYDLGAHESQGNEFIVTSLKPDGNGILYIKTNGSGDGSSWNTAANNLNFALFASTYIPVTQIWAAEGVYKPTETSDKWSSFGIRNQVKVFGGFAGTESDTSQREISDINADEIISPWEFLHETILEGDLSTNDSLDHHSYHVVNAMNVDTTALFDGFTIRGGNAGFNSRFDMASMGGGAYKGNFRNCSFRNNNSHAEGGGAYMAQLTNCLLYGNISNMGAGCIYSDLKGCTITKNSAGTGGGVYRSKLLHCVLDSNSATFDGGGGYGSTFEFCTLSSNTANYGGGASNSDIRSSFLVNNLANYGGGFYSQSAINSLVANNHAQISGGGAYYGRIINSTVVNNTSNDIGGAYASYTYNSILWGNNTQLNYGGVTFSAVENGANGNGNINLESINSLGPRFVNPSDSIGRVTTKVGLDYILSANWALQSNSPCIDAGNNTLYTGQEFDIAGRQRIINGAIDMGAYESLTEVRIPVYTINYITELTNEPAGPAILYSFAPNFEGEHYTGTNNPIPLFPGANEKWVYFKYTTDTSFSKPDSLKVPARPANPSVEIDFVDEAIVNVSSGTVWNISDTAIELADNNTITSYIPNAGEDSLISSVLLPATDSSFAAADTQELAIAPRPFAPENLLVDDVLNTFGWSWSALYTDPADYEVSIDNGEEWVITSENPFVVGQAEIPAGYVQVRVMASNEALNQRFKSMPLLSEEAFTAPNSIAKNEIGFTDFKVYPSIASDAVYCQNYTNDVQNLKVFNLTGINLSEQLLLPGLNKLDISDLKQGFYLLKIGSSTNETQTFKIFKE